MKKIIAFVLVLALCLSLCSVALAAPSPVKMNSYNANIAKAISTYRFTRMIVERAKVAMTKTFNLARVLKLALPVGVAAAAVTGGILYALLKGNGGKDDVTIETVADLLEQNKNFPCFDSYPDDKSSAWDDGSGGTCFAYKDNGYTRMQFAYEGNFVLEQCISFTKKGNDYEMLMASEGTEVAEGEVGYYSKTVVIFQMNASGELASIQYKYYSYDLPDLERQPDIYTNDITFLPPTV